LKRRSTLACGALVVVALAAIGCGPDAAGTARYVTAGEPERGRRLVRTYGCHTCHDIPGVPGAAGKVGPPLGGIGTRVSLAGELPNTPDDLVTWIRHPQEIAPGSLMPDMGVGEQDARDIAAYLLTQP
jgi:cytochrome c